MPAEGASSPVRGARARRLLQQLALLALLVAAGVVLVAAFPVLARLLRPGAPEAARRGLARVMLSRGYAVPPARAAGASVALPSSELEGLFPHRLDGEPDGEPSVLPGAGRGGESAGVDGLDGDGVRAVVAKGELVLRDRANPDGAQVGRVPAGRVLVVLRDSGRWLLVAFKQGDAIRVGWAPRQRVLSWH